MVAFDEKPSYEDNYYNFKTKSYEKIEFYLNKDDWPDGFLVKFGDRNVGIYVQSRVLEELTSNHSDTLHVLNVLDNLDPVALYTMTESGIIPKEMHKHLLMFRIRLLEAELNYFDPKNTHKPIIFDRLTNVEPEIIKQKKTDLEKIVSEAVRRSL